jgi:hypothetical protein
LFLLTAKCRVQFVYLLVALFHRFQQSIDQIATLDEVTARLGPARRDGGSVVRPYYGELL